MKEGKKMSRRNWFRLAGCVGISTVGGSMFLSSCKKKDPCLDLSGLTAAELKVRKSLNYVEVSPKPNKNCGNCNLYKAPENNQCGGCKIFKGPVTQKGYCKIWSKKQ